jgi:nucleotide-binding universal stress UspA family protein
VRPFDTIVCALDLHPAADRALPYVAALARGRRVAVEVLTVVDDAARTVAVTAELAARARQHGLIGAELFAIRAASVGSVITDHVSHRDGALLVIATTAHGGHDEHQLGAVTDDVLRRTHQPVMVVGPRAALSSGCLVVLVDDEGGADAAMPIVQRWLTTFGDREVRVVEVRAPDAWPEHVDDEPASCVDQYVDQLAGRGISATGEAVSGIDPVESVIAGMARTDVAMVVVTSPADIGQPTHWFHTARRLIRFSPRPVLVVPLDLHPPGSRR